MQSLVQIYMEGYMETLYGQMVNTKKANTSLGLEIRHFAKSHLYRPYGMVKNRKHVRAKNRNLRNRYIDYEDI